MIGRVYKIICEVDKDFCYIGSTVRTLNVRWSAHKNDYKCWKEEGKVCKMSTYDCYDRFGINNFSIELIKEYKVCDKNNLEAYEQLWINKSKCVNKFNTFRIEYLSQKEYREENKEVIYEQRKKYREKNKEVIYEKKKKYREKNKEVISEKKKIKTTCECGSIVKKDYLAKHKKTQKHIKYIENL
jgi:hypothetical protein